MSLDEDCARLATKVFDLIGEHVYLEEHEEEPGEWGAWIGEGDDAELAGSGNSKLEALESALAQAETWKANEGRPSHPRSRFE